MVCIYGNRKKKECVYCEFYNSTSDVPYEVSAAAAAALFL